MPTIYALSGVSGVGKTYTRTHDPKLKDLPCLDIADMYVLSPGASPQEAHTMFAARYIEMMAGGDFVLEAYFRRGSTQRMWLEYHAECCDYTVEYIELSAPVEVCRQRVQEQFERDMQEHPELEEQHIRYRDARLFLLGVCV
jgi:hypothetical protein